MIFKRDSNNLVWKKLTMSSSGKNIKNDHTKNKRWKNLIFQTNDGFFQNNLIHKNLLLSCFHSIKGPQ